MAPSPPTLFNDEPPPAMRVISASRRTDIPAFYTPWLLNRLRAGFCDWANPFGGKINRVSLRAEDCIALVFWTRNPAPLLPHLAALRADGYHCYVHFTLTGYPRLLEPFAPPVEDALDSFRRLAGIIGDEFVQWRYDPVLIGSLLPVDEHRARFTTLARALQGYTRRCLTSFVSLYGKTARNLHRLAAEQHLVWENPEVAERRALCGTLRDIAGEYGMTLYACCNPELVGDGIPQAHCIDPLLLRKLRPDLAPRLRHQPTRPGCGCIAATDIGAYDTCVHGCVYCYATNSRAIALKHLHAHNPQATLLR